MALYDSVDGVYRKVSKKYDPVNGVYRKVKAAYDPVDGVYRQYFSGATPISTLTVGDSVWLNVNGVQTEFLVVHQGNPDSALYDASCDGTWLLMKGAFYSSARWDTSLSNGNNYQSSSMHNNILNGTIFNSLDDNTKTHIKTVKIPYVNGTGSSGSVASGTNGLSTKIFLLSAAEVNMTDSRLITGDGSVLSYFQNCNPTSTCSRRVCYNDGTQTEWWLRSVRQYNGYSVYIIDTGGGSFYDDCSDYSCGVRPAFILDSSTPIDNSTGVNIIA